MNKLQLINQTIEVNEEMALLIILATLFMIAIVFGAKHLLEKKSNKSESFGDIPLKKIISNTKF